MDALKIQNVSKSFKKFKALDDVNLVIPKGRIIGLLGRNGAGKSTLMRCILGFYHFEGDIHLEGKSVKDLKHKINHHIAFIPDVNGLDNRLTVQQTIEFIASVNPAWNQAKAERLMEISELPLKKKVAKLSKGMKTKLYLLITLSLDVDILMLDEPTLGLDITFRKEFFNTILGEYFTEDKTIIISTHQVEEVEHILDDIIFIDNGKIILYESIDELKSQYRIASVPTSNADDLYNANPLSINKSFGHINGIIPSDINIEGAEYATPSLSDLFVAKVGGHNESV
jgi:ABC-2 type transport system ATP-binding protein